jgi:hypothetical protein
MLLETGFLLMAAAKLDCSGPNEIIEEAAKGLAGKLSDGENLLVIERAKKLK